MARSVWRRPLGGVAWLVTGAVMLGANVFVAAAASPSPHLLDGPPPSASVAASPNAALASPDAGSLPVATGGQKASATATVQVVVPTAVRLVVQGDDIAPVSAVGVQGRSAGAGAGAESGQVVASARVQLPPGAGAAWLDVSVFANAPWALFVRAGGAAFDVQVGVPEVRYGPGRAAAGGEQIASALTLPADGPGRLLARSSRVGVTTLKLKVSAQTVPPTPSVLPLRVGPADTPALPVGLAPAFAPLPAPPAVLAAVPGRQPGDQPPGQGRVELHFSLVARPAAGGW